MNHSKALVMLALTFMGCAATNGISTCNQAQAAKAETVSKEFLSFYEGFKDALRKNDKNAIADMTKLPYLDQDQKKLNRAAFIAQTEKIFSPSIRKCLLTQKPVPDQKEVFVFCGDAIYIFAKNQGKFKFSEIGVND